VRGGVTAAVDEEVDDRAEDRKDEDEEDPRRRLASRPRMPLPDDVDDRRDPEDQDENAEKPPEPRHFCSFCRGESTHRLRAWADAVPHPLRMIAQPQGRSRTYRSARETLC